MVPAGAKTDIGTNFFTAFTTGKVGIIASGAFAIGTLRDKYPNIHFGVAPLPGKDGGSSSFAGGDVIAIPKGSKHPEQAWKFIDWCLQDNTQINLFAKGGSIPVRLDLTDQYVKRDPRYAQVVHGLEVGKTPDSVQYNQLINDSHSPWTVLVQHAIFGKSVDDAIAEAKLRFQQIQAEP